MLENENLNQEMALAFAQMSKSIVLNRLYAAKVKREGKNLLSRLLYSIAKTKEIHARRTLMYLRDKIGDPTEYLEGLLQNKNDDAATKYPGISRQLEEAGKKKAAEAFDQFGAVAKGHLKLLKEVLQENAHDSTDYYVCQICGYIAKDMLPLKCSVCNAVQEKFKMED